MRLTLAVGVWEQILWTQNTGWRGSCCLSGLLPQAVPNQEILCWGDWTHLFSVGDIPSDLHQILHTWDIRLIVLSIWQSSVCYWALLCFRRTNTTTKYNSQEITTPMSTNTRRKMGKFSRAWWRAAGSPERGVFRQSVTSWSNSFLLILLCPWIQLWADDRVDRTPLKIL